MLYRETAQPGRKELSRSAKDEACAPDITRFKSMLIPILTIAWMLFLSPGADAQKVLSIGSLNTADQFINSFEGFRSRMAELGYRNGQNVRYQYYNSRGNDELLRTVAHKLVQEKVDMIVTSSTTATVIAAKATPSAREYCGLRAASSCTQTPTFPRPSKRSKNCGPTWKASTT